MLKRTALKTILLALPLAIRLAAKKSQPVRARLAGANRVIQVRLRDGSLAHHYIFKAGRVRGHAGLHPSPDGEMVFKSVDMALAMLNPSPDYAIVIDALKNFKVTAGGKDVALVWFGRLMSAVGAAGWKAGVELGDGVVRYTNLTNGGPIYVDVKDGKILRTVPIDLKSEDAPSWTISARGRQFSPVRKALVSPHALSLKSMVYSDKRLLYPMKRVDVDFHAEVTH